MPKTDLVLSIPESVDNDPIYFKDHVIGAVHDALEQYGHRSLASEYAGRIRGYVTKHEPRHWDFNKLCDVITGEYVDIHFLSHINKPEIHSATPTHEQMIHILADQEEYDTFVPITPKRTNSYIIVNENDEYADFVSQTYEALVSDGYEAQARDFLKRMAQLVTDYDPVSRQLFEVTNGDFLSLIDEYVWILNRLPSSHQARAFLGAVA